MAMRQITKEDLKQLLFFDKMFTVPAIKFGYWLGLFVVLSYGLMELLNAAKVIGVLYVLVGVIVTVVFLRIFCEFLIVMFGIHERLGEIRDALETDEAKAKKKK